MLDTDAMTDLSRGLQSKMGIRHGIELVDDMLGERAGSACLQVHMQRELL